MTISIVDLVKNYLFMVPQTNWILDWPKTTLLESMTSGSSLIVE